MKEEQRLKEAERLARALAGVDDNEVKKAYGFLVRERDLNSLHSLVNQLPDSPFRRSGGTPYYYRRMKEVIPDHLPTTMAIDDALWIFGWACRLLKYEKVKGRQRGDKPVSRRKLPKRGRPR